MFFLYGYGGIGKTFMWKALASALRSKGDITLIIASSGIAHCYYPMTELHIQNLLFMCLH